MNSTERLVTMKDVHSIIEEMCYSHEHEVNAASDSVTASVEEQQSMDKRELARLKRPLPVVPCTSQHRLQMDRLLAAIKPDVMRLADQRELAMEEQQEVGSRFSARSEVPSMSASSASYAGRLREHLAEFAAASTEAAALGTDWERVANWGCKADSEVRLCCFHVVCCPSQFMYYS